MNQHPQDKNNIGKIQNILFIFTALLLCAGVALGFDAKPGAAGLTFAAAIFCLIFAYLSQFKRFKGLGIEAELWDQKQEEAARLVETLRSLATVVSEQLIALSARAGRWDSATPARELFELTEKLDSILSSIDMSPAERDSIKAPYYRYTAIDMAGPICSAIDAAISVKEEEQHKLINGFGSPVKDLKVHQAASQRLKEITAQKIDWNHLLTIAPNSEFIAKIERVIDSADCLNADEKRDLRSSVAEELEDLREWVINRRLRRPEDWFARRQ